MGRIVLLAALAATAPMPALAQAVDPAVTACEALARDIVGPKFESMGRTMVGRTVFVHYAMDRAGGSTELYNMTCAFQLDGTTGQWTLDRAPTSDAALCAQLSAADMPPKMREMPQMQAAFEKCVPIMKAEDIRQARLAVLDPLLRQSGRYPIDQRDTALKPGP